MPPPATFCFGMRFLTPFPVPSVTFLRISKLAVRLRAVRVRRKKKPGIELPKCQGRKGLMYGEPVGQLKLDTLSV